MVTATRTPLDLSRDPYRIDLDKRWKLEELYQFSRNFEQAYFAYFALYWIDRDGGEESVVYRRVSNTLKSYPWRGGYSVVSFYTGLKETIGRKHIPEVKAIKYSSPGFMELLIHLPVAVQLAGVVTSIALAIGAVNTTYNAIYRGMRERKLNEINVEKAELNLAKEHLDFLRMSCEELGRSLQVEDIDRLIEMSGNELRALKVLQSMYRRVRVLSNYQNDGKAFLLTNRVDE